MGEHDWSQPVAELQPHVAGHGLEILIARAIEHRVGPPVLLSLDGLSDVDPTSLRRLQDLHRRGLARQMLAVAELRLVSQAFASAGLRWAVVKGAVVAHGYYTRPDLRTYSDIDVLVDRSNFAAAVTVLERVGAQVLDQNWDLLCADARGQVHLRLPAGTPLDLHWHLVNRGHEREAVHVRTGPLLERARTVDVGGLAVPTLDGLATLAHLCLHAGLSGGDRLGWLKDVDRATAHLDPDWDALVALAREWRARLLIGLVLRRTHATLGTPVPASVFQRLLPRWTAGPAAALDLSWPIGRRGTGYSPLHLVTTGARDRGWAVSGWSSRLVVGRPLSRVVQAARHDKGTPPSSPEFAIRSGHRDRYFSLVGDDGGVADRARAF